MENATRSYLSGFIVAVTTLFILSCFPVLAGQGFPGQGDPADWSDALPYYNRANRYLNTERYDQAVEGFKDAISRYQYDPDFYINLGVAYRKLNDYANAQQAFKKALELDGKDWMSWSNLGNAYLKQDKLKETVGAFQHALQCGPPPAEKAKIQQDIADINKILSMQNNGKQDATAAKSPPGQKSTNKAKPPAPKSLSSPTSPADQKRLDEETKSSGWDFAR